jgi:hypothetical protein
MLQAASGKLIHQLDEDATMEREKKEQQSRARKPFRKPNLRVYGHISAITQAVHNNQGAKDGNPSGAGMRTAG